MKKIFFLVLMCILFPNFSYADREICPTLKEIHSGNLKGWSVLNANNNFLVDLDSNKVVFEAFGDFYQAEYFEDGRWNAHCYYQGDQEFYFAKNIAFSRSSDSKWWFNGMIWRCRSSDPNDCIFYEK